MQRLPRVILIFSALVIGYWVWPLHAALQIREAMIAGDTATLARRVEWNSVRATLKASIGPEAAARLEADPNAPQPSLWQRIKNTVRPTVNIISRRISGRRGRPKVHRMASAPSA